MKTFQEFLEEAYLVEMRKEDKVKGKGKTPLRISHTRSYTTPGSVRKEPEGSEKKWKVTPARTETILDLILMFNIDQEKMKRKITFILV